MLPSVSFNGADGGDPCPCADPGYLELTIPFTGYNQQSDLQWEFPTAQNWAGQVVYVRYRLVSGLVADPNAPAGILLILYTGSDFTAGLTAYTNLPAPVPEDGGPWEELDFDLTNPYSLGGAADGGAGFDPTMVRVIELQVDTGAGTGPGPFPPPTTAVFDVDMIGLKPAN